jgi:3'-phosphoadenosine 5'-phosphosulfate sulfotransferase (PAPS reductase)/FAD synthetase
MEEKNADHNIAVFKQKQSLPYEAKVRHAEIRAREFYDALDGRVHVSVGGLDSITLLLFLRGIGIDCPAVSVSSLEDGSIRRIHKELGVCALKPLKRQVDVIREFGFPVLSKETAQKIAALQNPTEKNATVRHAIITGETGAFGGYRYSKKMRLSKCWLRKFGGPENEREGTDYGTAPFRVSDKCCYYLKEKPGDQYARENGTSPYLGLMASEHGRREKSLMINGCNYFGKRVTRSAPFAVFSRDDLLRLALDLDVPVPEIYGEIKRDDAGGLYTTMAQRTGCSMCGFGIHLERRPHRFDRLREANPKAWRFWMYDVGWGEVLNYIGIGWKDDPAPQIGMECVV